MKEAKFKKGDKVYFGPNNKLVTVVQAIPSQYEKVEEQRYLCEWIDSDNQRCLSEYEESSLRLAN